VAKTKALALDGSHSTVGTRYWVDAPLSATAGRSSSTIHRVLFRRVTNAHSSGRIRSLLQLIRRQKPGHLPPEI